MLLYGMIVSTVLALLVVFLLIRVIVLKKRAYETLCTMQERTEKLLQVLPGRIVILNAREKILFVHAGDLPGIEPVGMTSLKDIPGFNYEQISLVIREVFASGAPRMLEYEYRGVKRVMFLSTVPRDMFNEDAVIWFSHDNSELQDARLRAQEYAAKLESATKMWNNISNALPIHIFVKDADDGFRYLFNNRSRAAFFGVNPEELNGKSDYDLVSKDVADQLRRDDELNIATPDRDEEKNLTLADRNGHIHDFRIIQQPFRDENGRRLLLGAAIDVTELSEERRKVEESHVLLDTLLTNLPVGVAATEPDRGFQFSICNRAFAKMEGRTPEDIIGRTGPELGLSAYRARNTLETDREIVRSGEKTDRIEKRGEEKIYHVVKFPLTLPSGRSLLVGVFADVTEFEHAKRLAEESSEWFRRTLNAIGDGVITTDAEGRVVLLNPVAERMTGYTAAEAKGRSHELFFNIVRSGDEEPSPSPITRTLRTGTIVELANHTDLIARDGKHYHISDSAAPIFDKDGAVLGAILVFRDVTESYMQRDRLRATAAQLETGSALTRSATFLYDPVSDRIAGSRMFPRLWPHSDGRALPPEKWIYPEDMEKFGRVWQAMREGRAGTQIIEFRAPVKNTLHYYRLQSRTESGENGASRIIGVIQDVTDIARSLAKLREQQDLWDMVADSIPVMIFVKRADDQFHYTLTNSAFEQFVGKTKAEIAGRTDADIFNRPQDAEWFREWDRKIMKNGQQEFFETAQDNRGSLRTIRTVKKPFVSASGEQMLLGVSVDVTDLQRLIRNEEIVNTALKQILVMDSFASAFDKLSMILRDRLGCCRVIVARMNDRKNMEFVREWHDEKVGSLKKQLDIHLKMWNDGVPELEKNRIVKIDNFAAYPGADAIFREESSYPVRSVLAAPVFIHEKLGGMLLVSFTGDIDLPESDEKLMRSLTSIIELTWLREQQNLAVRQADRQRQLVLYNIHIPIWLHDGAGRLIRANTAVGELFDISPDVLTTEMNHARLAAALPEGVPQPVEEAVRTGHTVHREITLNNRKYQVFAEPVFDGGKLICVVKSAIDFTEFDAMLRSRRTLSEGLETLIEEPDLKTGVNRMLHILCDYVGACRAYVFSMDVEQNTVSAFVEYCPAGDTPFFGRFSRYPFSTTPLWSDRFRTERTIAVENFKNVRPGEIGADWISAAEKNNICSLYATRLMIGTELYGYVGLAFDRMPRSLSPAELAFVQSFAHYIEIMLQRDRAFRNVQLAERDKAILLADEQSLNSSMNAVIRTENPDGAASAVLETVGRRLNASRCYILKVDHDAETLVPCCEYRRDPEAPSLLDMPPVPLNESGILQRCDSPVFVADTTDGALIDGCLMVRAVNEKCSLRSLCLVGIYLNGKLWGDFGIAYTDPHEYAAHEKEFILAAVRVVRLMVQRSEGHRLLVEALRKAENADRAKSYFIASVSHEIRTPLNAVIGFADLLKDPSVDERTRADYLDSIHYSGNALLQLINDVLDLSKLEADQMEIIPENTDFAALGNEVMRVFALKALEKHLTLKLDIPSLPELKIDKMRIRQILFNIIGNAVKFTPAGSITLSASFQPGDNSRGTLTFAIADTGIGIAPEDRERLMKPFVQLSKLRGTNASNNGTGLGLAICNRLMKKMGGTIQIESEENRGSVFRFILSDVPCGAPVKTAGTNMPESVPAGPDPATVSMLLVDDVAMNLKVMKAMCLKAGIADVATASNGLEALAQLEKRRFTLILTDMWMPGMNGSCLAAKIREDRRFDDMPIIAVTADVEAGDNFDLQFFTGILLKPVTLEKVRKMLAVSLCQGGGAMRNVLIMNELQ